MEPAAKAAQHDHIVSVASVVCDHLQRLVDAVEDGTRLACGSQTHCPLISHLEILPSHLAGCPYSGNCRLMHL